MAEKYISVENLEKMADLLLQNDKEVKTLLEENIQTSITITDAQHTAMMNVIFGEGNWSNE